MPAFTGHSPRWLLAAMAVPSLLACISTRFTASPGDRTQSDGTRRFAGRTVYLLTCQAERSEKREITLPNKAEKYAFLFEPTCEQQKDVVVEINKTRPLNIVVVLDRTASMQPSIDAVKNSIEEFAKGLESFKWDARYAAIGFRDEFNDFLISPFGEASTMRQAVSSWRAEGGGDYQEGGQQAILHAFTMLAEFNKRESARQGALNIVLYVSDGAAFWDTDHSDFSVSKLSERAVEWQKKIPNLRFYHSATDTLDPLRDQGIAAPVPRKQMEELQATSKLNGRALDFPLTRQILMEFSKEFVQVTSTDPLLCQAAAASLVSSPGQGVPSRSQLPDILAKTTASEPLVFATSADVRTTQYTLAIERCCKLADMDVGCVDLEKVDVKVKFNQAE